MYSLLYNSGNLISSCITSEMHLWFGRQVGSIRSITERRSMLASVTRSCPHLWRAGEIMWQSLRSAVRLLWCTYSVSWSDTASTVGGTTPSTKSNSGKPWAHERKVPGLKKKNLAKFSSGLIQGSGKPKAHSGCNKHCHPHNSPPPSLDQCLKIWRLNGNHGIFILIIHPYQVPAIVDDLENQCNHCLHAEFEMFCYDNLLQWSPIFWGPPNVSFPHRFNVCKLKIISCIKRKLRSCMKWANGINERRSLLKYLTI